jgi:Rps23 Pro-64 3,4-dihydroxylase Tpa1-like proline 4-hydroxylase
MAIDSRHLAELVAARLRAAKDDLSAQFRTPGRVESFALDDLLEPDLAARIHRAFPPSDQMMLKKSLREFKRVAVQMDRYDPLCSAALFAFQDPVVVGLIGEITGLPVLHPDPHLYAGGLSVMERDHFLNPHLDNSHDKDRSEYRVLNLLYYVTPGWGPADGGNLELWDQGPKGPPRVVESRFNRLVCMSTHRRSWHSVQRILRDDRRCCVSNYYFSPTPLDGGDYFHVTSFRGRPEQPMRDLLLRGDIALRQGLRKVFRQGVLKNPHVFKRPED